MRTTEGISVNLAEESMLDSSGILVSSDTASPRAYGMTPELIELFMAVAVCGESGLSRHKAPKSLAGRLDELALTLELRNLIETVKDPRRNGTKLVLTWQGVEALAAAKSASAIPKKAPPAKPRRRFLG